MRAIGMFVFWKKTTSATISGMLISTLLHWPKSTSVFPRLLRLSNAYLYLRSYLSPAMIFFFFLSTPSIIFVSLNNKIKIVKYFIYLSVFCFSLSSSLYVCCNLSVRISKFLVNLYSASNFSDNKTRSLVASWIGTSDMYSPFLKSR